MKAIIHAIQVAIGVVGAAIASAFGGWSAAMTTLLIFMAVDYITGLIVAGVFHASKKSASGALDSRAGLKGLCRKGMALLVVLIAARLDILMHSHFIRDAVVIAFCANEGLSIIENAGLMGVPIPRVIRVAIDALHDQADKAADSINQKELPDDDLTPEEAACQIKMRNPELHRGEDDQDD